METTINAEMPNGYSTVTYALSVGLWFEKKTSFIEIALQAETVSLLWCQVPLVWTPRN